MTKLALKLTLLLISFVMFAAAPARAGETTTEFPAARAPQYLPRETVTIQTQGGHDYMFDVEMATQSDQQYRGLMFRESLNNDAGMLFLSQEEGKKAFWMKDTLIPLDLIFIARDGRINHIHHNAQPLDESMITTDEPALAVLEINGGLAGKLGIKEGDKILHPAFRNVAVSKD